MATVEATAPGRATGLKRRRARNRVTWGLCAVALALVVIPVVWIVGGVADRALAHFQFNLLTTYPVGNVGGLLNSIEGTAVIVVGVLILAGVVGMAGGIYLAEYAGNDRGQFLRGASEVLAGVPSIILGYVGYIAFVVEFHWGYSLYAGIIVLSVLVVPYITKTTEVALRNVPTSYREGGEALGMHSGHLLRRLVLRPALPGIATGVIIAAAIAVGETAPLLLTVGYNEGVADLCAAPLTGRVPDLQRLHRLQPAEHVPPSTRQCGCASAHLSRAAADRGGPRGRDDDAAAFARPAPAGRKGRGVSESVTTRSDHREAGGRTRVLIVEDDESYREALHSGLSMEGYEIELAADGIDGLRRFASHPPDLVLLDVLLPGMAGTEVCRRMRDIAPVPVIMVSALNTEIDVVLGLELGAADYVTKPYRMRELVARIQAVLRRVSPPPIPAPPAVPVEVSSPRSDAVNAGLVRVDFARRVVTTGGRPVHLSRREFDLLALLLSPPGQVRTRDELIDRLWSGRDLADTRTLDTHVRRLRVKLERNPARPQYLVTVRGVGFRFDTEGRGETELDEP